MVAVIRMPVASVTIGRPAVVPAGYYYRYRRYKYPGGINPNYRAWCIPSAPVVTSPAMGTGTGTDTG